MFHHISNIENIAVVIVITKNNNRANLYRAATDSLLFNLNDISGPSQDHS